MLHILIVEDEPPISSMIALALKKNGYTCEVACDGAEAADKIEEHSYDLILLDVMLPEISGFDLMKLIAPKRIPVIFLTACDAVEDRVKGLTMGAEDYVVKPFAIQELLARIEVVLRRYQKGDEAITFCHLTVLPRSMQVYDGEQLLPLTKKEYELLLLFLRHQNTALYRETIYEQVWGGDLEYGSKAVDLAVQRLRKKAKLGDCLVAVSGVGYRLEVAT